MIWQFRVLTLLIAIMCILAGLILWPVEKAYRVLFNRPYMRMHS